MKIDTDSYKYFGMWKCVPFAEYFWADWYSKDLLDKIGINIPESGVLNLKGGHFLLKKKVYNKATEELQKIIASKDNSFFQKYRELSDEIYKDALERSRKIKNKNVATADNIKEITEIGKNIMFIWCLGWMLSDIFDQTLEDAAKKDGFKSEEISGLIPKISTPMMNQQSELRQLKSILQEKGLWDLLKEDISKVIQKINDDQELKNMFDEHLKNYSWLQIIMFTGEDLRIEDLLSQMTYLKDEYAETVHKPLSEDFKYYIKIASELSYARQTGAEYFSIYCQMIMPMLKIVAEKLEVSYRELLDLMPWEIEGALTNGTDVKSLIKKRENDNWCIFADEKGEIHIVDELGINRELEKKLIPTTNTSTDEKIIKGQIGNKGVARGRVKIILANDEFGKLKEGDVLVTTMTTPDFVILMQRACAIVTDIGGLLCHAAIVSREINKPCIIGTKFATSVLKDEMEVEVDANTGMVKIL